MSYELRLLDVTGPDGALLTPEWLARAEEVHRQLRPRLPDDYAGRMQEVFAGGGRMLVALDGAAVVGVAVYRLLENTADGRKLYVDDLVTDEARRSGGLGAALLAELEARARALGCDVLALDSGVQRTRAHAFYLREGFAITSYAFRKPLARARSAAAEAEAGEVSGPHPGDPALVERVLRALPEWFGIEQAIRDYAAAAPGLETWTASVAGEAVGFVGIKRHAPQAAEVYVMGVLPAHHRRGLGARLLRAAEAGLAAAGVRFLQVKTLSPAREDAHYASTRAFYEAQGFTPLEELPTLWGAANPCRVYVKALGG